MDRTPKVLFVNGLPVDKGGVETAIMEVYRGIDREKLRIDFAVRKPQKGSFDDEIMSYGGRVINIFEETEHKGNKKWNFSMDLYSIYSFYKILKSEGPYCAVHIAHPILDGFLILAAKMAGIKVIIAHSQNTGLDDKQRPNLFRVLTRKLRLLLCRLYATHLWGCSKAACEYQFGKNILKDRRAEVVPYPVDIKKYMNKPCKKDEACDQLAVPENRVTFINVGRYAPQKNQLFLLDVFAEMIVRRKDIQLLLTGPGEMEETIKDRIKQLGIEDHVTMLDSNTYIPLALAASDYFVLPSIYEGFGIVLIEAQAAGIPCFASDACQPEPNLGFVDYIPLEKGKKYWADYLLSNIDKPDNRVIDESRLMEYEVTNVAPCMQEVYLLGVTYKEASRKNLKEGSLP